MAKELTKYIIRVRSEEDIDQLITDMLGWKVQIIKRYTRLSKPTLCVAMTGLLAKWFISDERIEKIEKVGDYSICSVQNAPIDAPFLIHHLDRIDQRSLPLTNSYTYASTGLGTTAYVIDTGCFFAHPEFEGRVSSVDKVGSPGTAFDPFIDAIEAKPANLRTAEEINRLMKPRGSDERGHGTHVCGIIGSKTYGVAKKATIKTAKIFGATTDAISTTTNVILDAIEAVVAHYADNSLPSAVCNMSFGAKVSDLIAIGDDPTILEDEINAMISSGITVCAAAGNAGSDANNYTPARIPDVITVGAVDEDDRIAAFSNFGNPETLTPPGTDFGSFNFVGTNTGSAVDIFAPGTNVYSTYYDPSRADETLVASMSGTSMASPMVAGVAVLVLQAAPSSTASAVALDISVNATDGAVLGLAFAAPNNKLLYSIFVDHSVDWITGDLDLPEPVLLESLPEGSVAEILLQATSTNGEDVTYTLQSGSLPPLATLVGDKIQLNGGTNGTTVDVTYTFTIRATAGSVFADRQFEIELFEYDLPPRWVTSSELGNVEEGEIFSIPILAEGVNEFSGTISYLPSAPLLYGWVLNPSTGVLSGIAPMVANADYTVTFTVIATDGTPAAPSTRTFHLKVTQRYDYTSSDGQPKWVTAATHLGTVVSGDTFSYTLQASDVDSGPQPTKFLLEVDFANGSILGPVGSLPDGLTLDENTGEITGTYTGTDTAVSQFAVYLSDGANAVAKLFEISTLAEPANIPPVWVTPAGDIGSVDSFELFYFNLMAIDSDGLPLNLDYRIFSGALPPGMTLNPTSGVIEGPAPFVSHETRYAFTVAVTDGIAEVKRTFAIIVNKVNVGPEWQTPSGLISEVHQGQAFAFPLIATDAGGDTLTYTLVSGTLPDIVSLNPYTGVLSGPVHDIPTDQTYTFTISVDDSLSNSPSEAIYVERTFSIKVLASPLVTNQPPVWTTPEGALPQATEGSNYFYQIQATDPDNGPEPISYIIVAGSMPPGLALNQNTGIISGTVHTDSNIVNDTFAFRVAAYDGIGYTSRNFTIEVVDLGVLNQPPVWITPSGLLGSFNESTPLAISLDAEDPDGDTLTYSLVAGTTPPGTSLSTTGIVAGTPNQVITDTTFVFIARVTDTEGGTADRTFSIEILNTTNIPPNWVTPAGSLGDIDEGSPALFVLIALDPDSGPSALQYTVSSGSLPPGLSLNATTGEITGSPDPVASDTVFAFDVSVSDGLASIPRSFTITVNDVAIYIGTTSSVWVPMLGDLRLEWQAWNNDTLIPDSVLYQPLDLDYGRVTSITPTDIRKEPKIYVAKDLHTDDPNALFSIFGPHHDKFKVVLSAPDYAVVRNPSGDVIYEVIYLRLIDPQEGSDFTITSPFVSKNFSHLRTELLNGIGNDDELPAWMTAEQTFGDSSSVIGYIPALEIAYVQPGNSADIIEALNEISFNIFEIDSTPTTFDAMTTTFDESTTTFDDYTTVLSIAVKGRGHQFVGREFIVDRYLFETSTSESRYIKFATDKPDPFWVTSPGLLGEYTIGVAITPISLEVESPVSSTITYKIVYGDLPDGLSLNTVTGEITGTPGSSALNYPDPATEEHRSFIVEAKDTFGRTSIRRFRINTVP